jgi:hypothetical protein
MGLNIRTTCTEFFFVSHALLCRLSFHILDMYERIECEVYPLPDTGDPSPPSVIVWAYEYCVPLSRTSAFRLVAQGNWPVLMRSESRCEDL